MQAAESWDFPSAREERRGFVQRRDQRHSILILERKNKNWEINIAKNTEWMDELENIMSKRMNYTSKNIWE